MKRRDVAYILALTLLFLVIAWSVADVACAHGAYTSTAAFLDAEILGPRGSMLAGDVLVDNWRWYGIDVLPQLVIWGAETALGTYPAGGTLVHRNNFGCIRAFGGWQSTKWGEWADGTVTIRGKAWLTWPTMEVGAHAWGRYIKAGADGRYLPILARRDWRAFANIYYGRNVPGIEHYIANLEAFDRRFRALAAAHGFRW